MFENVKHFILKHNSPISFTIAECTLDEFVARGRICKTKFTIPDMGPCTDLEFEEYIRDSGCVQMWQKRLAVKCRLEK